jgi:hypothetical protein
MVQVLKGAQDFELFGGFKPWHPQGEHSKIRLVTKICGSFVV